MYFFWASIINNLYLLFAIPPTLYSINYGDLNSRSLIYYKLRFYLTNTLGQSARYCIILACINRLILTTMNAYFQIFIQPTNARYLICIIFLFWHLFPIHILFSTTIINERLLMGVLGYLTYRNVRQLQLRIQPIRYPTDNNRGSIITQSR
ncbi:unnamed protein product [Rotaria sp. Silwood2]|nr:unnamed protein product [Rotaria sp. Silwood2]